MPQIVGYLRFAWQLANGFRLAGEQALAAERDRDLAPYLNREKPWQVLDLANGRLRPQFLILNAQGQMVYGIDWANRPESPIKDLLYRIARGLYGLHLAAGAGPSRREKLVCGDVGKLPFADCSFDLVTSIAAFEHFLDVPRVVSELERVLRPGGVAWIRIHPFACPSGGHNLGFTEIPLRAVPPGIDPWDHLRRRRLPFNVPLNEWRIGQYSQTFTEHFEIVKQYCATREGDEFLTPQIEKELALYSRDELTCAAYQIVARKPLA
ncbi:MAG: methyltransferase domain-containing protein [Anaerolineae bacterium]